MDLGVAALGAAAVGVVIVYGVTGGRPEKIAASFGRAFGAFQKERIKAETEIKAIKASAK